MRFGEGPRHNEKESRYMTSITDTPSRAVYTGGYLLSQCASRCFVDATPGNMLVPLAAARLRSTMSANEAVPSRPSPCAARAQLLHSGRTAT
jgi:GR25 family glycosyltransferase involved in LPS biosynthesis